MMDECTPLPKLYLFLSSTFDDILSWMIELWMKTHLVSDSNCNTVNLSSHHKNYKDLQITLG